MDKLLTNKYFCLALITALGLMAFMYNRKGGCDTERLQMIDLIPSTPAIFQRAGTDRPVTESLTLATSNTSIPSVPSVDDLSEVNGPFDQKADMMIEEKLRREGYKTSKPLKSLDASFRKYMLDSDSVPFSSEEHSSEKPRGFKSRIPMPNDTRPDLAQCQPCAQKISYKLR